MEITKEIAAVANEFTEDKYVIAMLQEIVNLRKKVLQLEEANESLQERLDCCAEELAGEDW